VHWVKFWKEEEMIAPRMMKMSISQGHSKTKMINTFRIIGPRTILKLN
jgi:hypothetical protein